MTKIVVDSSVILKWLYREDERYLDQADLLLKDAVDNKVKLITTELAKFEVGNVLLVAKKLSKAESDEALEVFYKFPIQFFNLSEDLSKATFILGNKAKITFYDASFVALAKQEGAALVTDNPKDQQKFKDIKVIALRDYK